MILVLAALRERLAAGVALRHLAIRLALVALVALVVIAPLKLIYPLSQPGYRAGISAMREERARDDFKPSNPTNPGYLLARKGVPFRQIVTDPGWYYQSAISFYGFFGYFTVRSPGWAYLAAALAGALALLGTLATVARGWGQTPPHDRLIFAVAPLWVALCVLASLYNSWTFDFQPQGRYLFSALIPLAILLGGPMGAAPPWQRRLGGLGWALLAGIALYILWFVVLPHPSLQPRL